MCSTRCGGSTGGSLNKILVVQKPVALKKKRQAVNSKASCITELPVLRELKQEKKAKQNKDNRVRAEEERTREKEEITRGEKERM